MTGEASGSQDDYVMGYPQSAPYPPYVLLPGSPQRTRIRKSCFVWSAFKLFLVALLVVSLATLGYMVFPRQPDIEVKRITLENISLSVNNSQSIIPSVNLDVSLSLRIKITNSNFFGVVYDNLVVVFSYRGDELGKVESSGGEVPSRSKVIANARLDLLGAPLMSHATELIEDVYNGEVPLQTVAEFSGAVEMFSLRPHINMKVYCNMTIDPVDKEVLSKDCSLIPFT
ncbi:unnamed protein product [Calypogeia fissa]